MTSTFLSEVLLSVGGSLPLAIAVKATVLSALALALLRMCRYHRASVRHLLLAATFVALLIVPVSSALMPAVRVARRVHAAHSVSVSLQPGDMDDYVGRIGNATAAPPAAHGPISVGAVAGLVWLAGIALCLIPIFTGLRQLASIRHDGRPWDQGQALAEELAVRRGVAPGITVLQMADARGFFSFGWRRPIILAPADAAEWPHDAIRGALIHEMEHVRRLDWVTLMLSRIACALYWFHPLVWVAAGRLGAEAEGACDDAVVRQEDPLQYAALLVQAAEAGRPARPPVLAMSSPGDLTRRVNAVLDPSRDRSGISLRAVAVGIGSALAIALMMSPQIVAAQTIRIVDDAKLPRFEVASVKPGDPHADYSRFGFPPGRFYQENAALFNALMSAFQLSSAQLTMPLPDLITHERFTIDARVPNGTKPADRLLMLRALLIDRFKLRYHIEHGETDGYALTVARRDRHLGPRLHASAIDCDARLAAQARQESLPPLPAGAAECGIHSGPGLVNFAGMPIAMLTRILSNRTGTPVVDETGLTGNFDVDLQFALGSAGPPRAGGPPAPASDDRPSIFTAVQEQLGLKLVPRKEPVDKLVIDHIERPDPD